MSEVLIVSKTHLHNGACVGGLELATHRSIRLMQPGNFHYQPADTPFEVGRVWDIQFLPHANIILPHIEDVIVIEAVPLNEFINDIPGYLLQNQLINWDGHIDEVFDGLLNWTNSGSGYIPAGGPYPVRSVGFWRPDKRLEKAAFEGGKIRFRYPNGRIFRGMAYVGYQEAIQFIDVGTILRVSLSRVFPREPENSSPPRGFYLQLSGWYSTVQIAEDIRDDLPF